MKTKNIVPVTLLTCSLFLFSYFSFAQWQIQPSGTGQDLNSVYFADNERGWIVGDEGVILNTDNGGDTWNVQISGTDFNLESVHFINQDTGWIAGGGWGAPKSGIILWTIDGGNNWLEIYYDSLFYLNDVYFSDKLNGWAAGRYHYLMAYQTKLIHTSDGGETWEEQMIQYQNIFNEIHFTDSDTGWVVGGYIQGSPNYQRSTIHKTTNGGATWEEQVHTINIYSPLKSVCFTDAENGWAVGFPILGPPMPNLLQTNDGGTQWDSIPYNGTYCQDFSLESVCFVNKNTGWIVGGMNWYIGSEYAIILQTGDGGDSWIEQPAGTIQMLNSVCFVDTEEGWIAADSGIILHTDNGGITAVKEDQFTSHQNRIQLNSFPNPFSSSTTIEFELQEPGKAEIKVYNQTCRFIEEFVQEEGQIGKNKFIWQINDLSPGIYFIRLQIGNETITKKIIKH